MKQNHFFQINIDVFCGFTSTLPNLLLLNVRKRQKTLVLRSVEGAFLSFVGLMAPLLRTKDIDGKYSAYKRIKVEMPRQKRLYDSRLTQVVLEF